MAGFLPSNFKEVKDKELDPIQREVLRELRRRTKKKGKVFRDPQDPGGVFSPELGILIGKSKKDKKRKKFVPGKSRAITK